MSFADPLPIPIDNSGLDLVSIVLLLGVVLAAAALLGLALRAWIRR